MANDLNQCNFTGRLGQDVETRFTQNGDAVANISLAVGWKSKDKEGTEWVRCVAFKRLAELMGQYLRKGSFIRVTGSMRTRKWQNQQGQDQYTTEIVVSDMQMLDKKSEYQQGAQNQGGGFGGQQQTQGQAVPNNAQKQASQQGSGFVGQQQATGFQQQPSPQAQGGGFSGQSTPTIGQFDDDLPF